MQKKLLLFVPFFISALFTSAQVVTTASAITVCTGATTVDIPVKVSGFTAVGSFSLKLSYVNSEIHSPSVTYKDQGLVTWGTFFANTGTPGTIIISAYDPDITAPFFGLTLDPNTILFTLSFTIGTITTPAVLSFVENAQGTSCEYTGIGLTFTPFPDTPQYLYYINGSVTVVPDPVAPGLTKIPADASVCAGQELTVSTSPGSGGTGTIADEYRYTTNNGTDWSVWSASTPSFTAVTGTSKIQSRRTATGLSCDESSHNEVSWTVIADPVAPSITKSPADATVCAGQALTVTTSPGSGGTGTIADEYRYTTNDGGAWSSWSSSVPSFAAVAGTDRIQSRRTANGLNCNESSYNDVSWTVVADPIAPGLTKNPVDATVCAGQTLTVSITAGSGGAGTIADEYRSSTNNGDTWSGWSASIPSFAAVAGTNKIQSRRTATGTGCDVSSFNEVSWNVNAKQKISGIFNYLNASGPILLKGLDITVKIYKSSDPTHSECLGTSVTDINGYYEFPALCPVCEYDIVATSAHLTEGAVNTTDAARTNVWGPNPEAIEKVRFHAGDVAGSDNFAGATDAQRIQQNFVYGTAFDANPWTFWKAGFTILHNPLPAEPEYLESFSKVNLSAGSDLNVNMYGLVTGDFNLSFNPNLTKSASSTLDLVYTGNRQMDANQEFDLPVKIMNETSLGAVSLILEFPSKYIEIMDVAMDNAGGVLDWSAKGNELRIGWNSTVPVYLAASAELLTLRLKTTSAFTIGNSVKFTLASNSLNELADARYDVIGKAILGVDVIDASTTGTPELSPTPYALSLSAYPNPFSNYSLLTYTLPFEGDVNLEISNITGNRIMTLVNGLQAQGNHSMKFISSNLPSGVYFAKLRLRSSTDELIRTIKLINNR